MNKRLERIGREYELCPDVKEGVDMTLKCEVDKDEPMVQSIPQGALGEAKKKRRETFYSALSGSLDLSFLLDLKDSVDGIEDADMLQFHEVLNALIDLPFGKYQIRLRALANKIANERYLNCSSSLARRLQMEKLLSEIGSSPERTAHLVELSEAEWKNECEMWRDELITRGIELYEAASNAAASMFFSKPEHHIPDER